MAKKTFAQQTFQARTFAARTFEGGVAAVVAPPLPPPAPPKLPQAFVDEDTVEAIRALWLAAP